MSRVLFILIQVNIFKKDKRRKNILSGSMLLRQRTGISVWMMLGMDVTKVKGGGEMNRLEVDVWER